MRFGFKSPSAGEACMISKVLAFLREKSHGFCLQQRDCSADSVGDVGRELSEILLKAKLSESEAKAAGFAARGYSSVEIAELMGVKSPTVRTYLQRSYKKLGISGIEELRQLASGYNGTANEEGWKNSRATVSESIRNRKLLYLRGRSLNEAEARIVLEIAAGKSGPAIASELNYSIGTVNAARHKAYRLLGVHTSVQFASALEGETYFGCGDDALSGGANKLIGLAKLAPCLVVSAALVLIIGGLLARSVAPAEDLVPVVSREGGLGYVYQTDLNEAATDPINDPSQAVDLMELKQQRLASNLAEELNTIGSSRIYTVEEAQELIDGGWASAANYYSSRAIDMSALCSLGGKPLSVSAEELAQAYEYASASSARHIAMYAADGSTVIGTYSVG